MNYLKGASLKGARQLAPRKLALQKKKMEPHSEDNSPQITRQFTPHFGGKIKKKYFWTCYSFD